MSRPTPGPWRSGPSARDISAAAVYCATDVAGMVRYVAHVEGCACFEDAMATADLIAAAPDLFAACDEADTAFAVLNISDLSSQARACVRKAWPMVQAARAKARPSGAYAVAIREAHVSEIARLDALNADLLGMLQLAVRYLDHPDVQAIEFAVRAECVAARCHDLIKKAGGVS